MLSFSIHTLGGYTYVQLPERKEISVPGTCCCQPIEDNLRHMRYSALPLRTLWKSM